MRLAFYVLFLPLILHSYEFKHFQLKGELKTHAENKLPNPFLHNNKAAIQGFATQKSYENNFYQDLYIFFWNNYQNIGDRKIYTLYLLNKQFDLGKENYSGFDWQRPIGSVVVKVNREIQPYPLNEELWLVSDTFKILIDAKTFLGNLKDENLLNIDDDSLGAFAGLQFIRTYTYNHLAPSFNDGLYSDYAKAFLSFKYFRDNLILDIDEGEYLSKEDYFALQTGAAISSVASAGFFGAISLDGKAERIARVSFELVPSTETFDKTLRISTEKLNKYSIKLSAGIRTDFFNLLKLTLFGTDLSYEYGKEKRAYLQFEGEEIDSLDDNPTIKNEIGKLLKFKEINKHILAPYINYNEERIYKNYRLNSFALLLGQNIRHNNEFIYCLGDMGHTYFYRSYDYKQSYLENPLSFIFSAFIRNILGFNPLAVYELSKASDLSIEFQTESINALQKYKNILSPIDNLSLRISQKFSVEHTKERSYKYFKNKTIEYIKTNTPINNKIINNIKNNTLIGPIGVQSSLYLNTQAIDYFESLHPNIVYQNLKFICQKDKRTTSKHCLNKLKDRYKKVKEISLKYSRIHLEKLRKFLLTLSKYTNEKQKIDLLFGTENTYLQGSLKAKTRFGHTFTSYFEDGKCDSLGKFDNYMRSNSLRAPANIPK